MASVVRPEEGAGNICMNEAAWVRLAILWRRVRQASSVRFGASLATAKTTPRKRGRCIGSERRQQPQARGASV
eukprot:3291277-Pleurochrysis_carterae.AAC.1